VPFAKTIHSNSCSIRLLPSSIIRGLAALRQRFYPSPGDLPGSSTMAVKIEIDEAWPTDTIASADRSRALVQHL
jgi:hypothetical protein